MGNPGMSFAKMRGDDSYIMGIAEGRPRVMSGYD
jgi:hypothetical protein